jgi:hypothetical protein
MATSATAIGSDAMLETPFDIPAWFHCPSCHATLEMREDGFDCHFIGGVADCEKCSSPIDLWAVMVGAVRDNFMLTGAYRVIGAKTKIFSFKLRNGENKEIVFKDVGIPEDAQVVSINYTPQAASLGALPIELHGNTPYRGLPREGVTVFGRSFPNSDLDETDINCAICWIRPPDADDGWLHLLDAFVAYAAGNWKGVVIPANIAAESAISRAVFDAIAGMSVTSKEHLEDFLANGATYSHQLNIVLPVLVKLLGIPPLDAHIRGLLNRLRGLRNKLTHKGALPQPLDKNGAAELVVAATFGFHYARFVLSKMSAPVATA